MFERGLFDRAREAVSIETLARAATKLTRSGAELRGACPICQAGAKSSSPPFAVKVSKGKWECYGCGERGDVVDLELLLRGGTNVEAAQRLIGGGYVSAPRVDAAPPPVDDGARALARLKTAQAMWGEGRPIGGTLAERYLLARGIPAEVIAQAAGALLFHPFARHSWSEAEGRWIKAPALLCRPCTEGEGGAVLPTGGVHATYLLRDGTGRDKALGKKMWGPQHGPDGRHAGAWLIGPASGWAPGGDLVVAEGIETALSIVALQLRLGRRMRACVALSLNRLQGGEARDEDGCVDPFRAVADPDRPPFVWTAPPADRWPAVLIGVDRDMSPVQVRGKSPRGRILPYERDGEVRARICGHLAVQGWRAAGAAAARAIAPSRGTDFNDELRRVLALEKTA